MTKPIAATMLSIMVFPGAGHFLLKRYIAGTGLACVAAVALYILMANTFAVALSISEKIRSGEIQFDPIIITQAVSQQTAGSDAQRFNIATAVLIIAWLVGIVDSYRVGRLQAKNAAEDV